jgi:hypothetical protein
MNQPINPSMSDSQLAGCIEAYCANAGTVQAVKIHRGPRPFALVDMNTTAAAHKLAMQYGRHPIGLSVLIYLEQMAEAPATPDNEAQRIAALHSLNLLFTASEERFDGITRLAAQQLGMPIALITLIAEDRQWFKSARGFAATETPRDMAFCNHAILGEQTMVIENALDDPRFAANPLVTGKPDIRFYAGHPLRTEDGSHVGTLCVIDQVPRTLTEDQLKVLRDLAALAEAELLRAPRHPPHP